MNTAFQLNPKGLLTAIVAVLLSGQALAETAGRVNFVVGDVSAISADGSRRVLARGDLVNSGERLETGKGRLQIRFTDGSFVSLQPNTVFGLDRYTFTKSNPTDGTLLFNFVRGGMRTVSGAIGKVNRANYKVQTPSATIGIRGTGYAATQAPDGRLLLTVSKGMVNLANSFGNSNVPAGQTFQVNSSKAPEKAPAGVSVEARADTPENDGEVKQKSQEKEDNTKEQNQVATQSDDDKAPDLAAGNQTSADGNPLFASAIQTTNGVPRLSSFGSLLKGSSGTQIYGNVLGLYSDLSPDGKTVGNLIGLIGTAGTGGNTEGKVILATPNGLKSLNFANVQQIGSLSFGEWTNGTAKSVDSYLQNNGLTLTNKQFIPYIVGTTAEKSLGNNLKVSYRLAGNTPVRTDVGSDEGTLSKLNIDIDLNFIPLVSVDLALSLAKVNYTAQLLNTVLPVSFDNLSGFVLSGVNTNFFATSSNSAICANKKCPVNLSAFLSSTDIGVVYEVQRTGLSTMGGVAALTGTESAITSQIPVLDRLPSRLETQYTAVFSAAKTTLSTPSAKNLAAVFDSTTGKLLSAFNTTTQDAELQAINIYGPEQAANDAAATTKEVGHFQKVLAWGMWSNGAVALGETDNAGATITHSLGNTNIHYMIGLPTTAALPKTGAVLYSFVGGTTPQATFATSKATVNDTGVINSRSSLAVNFDQATAQLGMSIDGFTKAQSFQSLHLTGASTLSAGSSDLNFSKLTVNATNAAGTVLACNPCAGQASGGFVGAITPIGTTGSSAPQGVGLSYNMTGAVQGTGFNVDGVAAFGNPTTQVLDPTKPAI